MPVNDSTVRRLINDAINRAPMDPNQPCCGRIRAAFRDLQARRQQPGASLDLDLAAAEHYMFARLMLCTGHVGQMQMRMLIDGYHLKKIIDRIRGNPNAEAVTSNPVSRPDPGVHQWARLGIIDGLADKNRCNAAVSAPFWRPIEEILGRGIY